MKITITRADNGFIAFHISDGDDGEFPVFAVFEDAETEQGGLDAMQKLLWHVMDYFGVYYSKHNKRNIVVKIENDDDKDE